jgi:hypothetical protein
MLSDLLVIGTGARSTRDAAGAAERKTDVEDRVANDLDFAGNAGERVIGTQAAHQGTSW